MIATGEGVREFEQQVAALSGARLAVATTSGTSALALALRCLDLPSGADIIIPTYVCRNVREAVVSSGFTPVLCDVGEDWNVTPETVAPHIGKRTGAIIVVHTFGVAADVSAFRRFGVPIVEDACQALGLGVDGRMAGTIGDIGVYSFHATKCLCAAEGGALISSRVDLVDRIREAAGTDSASTRMSDLHAALGSSQIARYSTMLARRRELAERYFHALASLGSALPWAVREKSIFFRFPIRLTECDFDVVRQAFERDGVHVRRGVDALLHRSVSRSDQEFPCATNLFNRTLSIPLYPSLTNDEVRRVTEAALRIVTSPCR